MNRRLAILIALAALRLPGQVAVHLNRPDGQTGPVVGKPFSGTEVRQVRAAGSGLVTETNVSAFYRDNQGRMRTESGSRALIYDPVGGFTYNLNTTAKTYIKRAIHSATASTSIVVDGNSTWVHSSGNSGPTGPLTTIPSSAQGLPAHAEPVSQSSSEDLGVQVINGINVKGSRITMTIPAWAFGNNHEVNVVNERWYSDDLQVLVKSSNVDPRFGTTSYELTRIVQGVPNPAMFQVPPDYTLRSEDRQP